MSAFHHAKDVPARKWFRRDDPVTGIERLIAGRSSSGIIINIRRGHLKS